MFEFSFHRQVALAALVAFAGLAGAVAGTPAAAADASPQELDSTALNDATTQSENVTASFVHDGDRVVLHSRDDQTVRLRTDAGAGTVLKMDLLIDGELKSQSIAEVSEDGPTTVEFNVTTVDVSAGTEVTLVARYDGRKLAETTGVVQEISTEFVHDGDRVVLENATNQTVEVRTDAEPGRELTVQIQGDQFIRTAPANVSADGTATATFDLHDVASGTEVTLQVSAGDAETVGVILNESAMAAETTTDAPTETATEENKTETTTEESKNETVQNETTQADTESGVPGFGVPVAFLALVVGVALARRG